MELSPLIKFEMVVKASLCMFIDRPSWTMQSIDPLYAFYIGNYLKLLMDQGSRGSRLQREHQ